MAQSAYLVLVITAFVVFGMSLFWVSWWSSH